MGWAADLVQIQRCNRLKVAGDAGIGLYAHAWRQRHRAITASAAAAGGAPVRYGTISLATGAYSIGRCHKSQ
jgi:hypothetical protein